MTNRPRLRLAALIAAVLVLLAVTVDLAGRWAGRRLSYTVSSGSESAERIDLLPAAQRQPAPAVDFKDEADRRHSLAELRGKVVLVNFWATWCPPCIAEMPDLDALQAELGGERFQVLALSVDVTGTVAARRWYEHEGLRHLAVYATSPGRVPKLPTTLLVDAEGRLAWQWEGAFDWTDPAVKAQLSRLAAEPRAIGRGDPAKGPAAMPR